MPVDLSSHYAQPLSRNLSHGKCRATFGVPAMVDSYPRDSENYTWIQSRRNKASASNESNLISSRYENYKSDSRGGHGKKQNGSFTVEAVREEADREKGDGGKGIGNHCEKLCMYC